MGKCLRSQAPEADFLPTCHRPPSFSLAAEPSSYKEEKCRILTFPALLAAPTQACNPVQTNGIGRDVTGVLRRIFPDERHANINAPFSALS